MRDSSKRQRRQSGLTRALILEALEERRLLDAGPAGQIVAEPAVGEFPWQNPVYRLDVNHDLQTTPQDALNVINRILTVGTGDLPDPGPNPPAFYYDTSGDNRLTGADLVRVINGILVPPVVTISSLTPYTADVTPIVTVSADSHAGVTDGTIVELDIDLNNDGDFGDPGELGHTQSTTFAGASTFEITPALERTDFLYVVNLRARVKNADAVLGTSPILPLGVDTIVSDALANYVNAPDSSYTYSLFSSSNQGDYTYYVLEMISQTWRSAADVNIPQWHHWMGLYVPNGSVGSTALLSINGGRNTSGPPSISTDFGDIAAASDTVVLELTTIPNEPVIFTDETFSRTEDEIIAYTYDKYMEHLGEPGNETWPLLLPMVKSVVRAMDSVQDFVPDVRPGSGVDDFVIFGGSKRGWTTWLTAAVDDRVIAMMPGVIDVLNIPAQMVHHYNNYGFFSQAIEDYENLQIFERLLTPAGRELFRIVDPYRYLANGRFDDMPKLIVNSAGDEFFVSDSAQFYYGDIPGPKFLRYFPNTGHGLDEAADEVVSTIISFYGAILLDLPMPDYSWTVAQDGSIHVETPSHPTSVKLWQATNPDSRDFRRLAVPHINWTSTTLLDEGGGNYTGDVPMPVQGTTAYFVELTFANPFPLLPAFVFTTEIREKSTLAYFPWPFDPGSPLPSAVPAGLAMSEVAQAAAATIAPNASGSALNAAAVALAIDSDDAIVAAGETSAPLLAPPVDGQAASLAPCDSPPLMLPDVQTSEASDDADAEAALIDALFGSSLDDLLD